VGLDELLKEEDEKRQNQIIDNLEKMKENQDCAETGTCNPEVDLQPTSNILATASPQASNPATASPITPATASPITPLATASQTKNSNSSNNQTTNIPTNESIDQTINENERLKNLFVFNDLLSSKSPKSTKKQQIDSTKERFYNYMRGGKNNDPQLELQKYLIENILAVLNVKIEDLFEKKNVEIDIDSNKYQAIILTLVRILLTQNMKDYNTFKQKLRITNTDNICDSLTTALNALSYRFVRWNTYSYNTILSNFQYAGACDDFDKIITVNLNKLYDMLVTKGSLYINEMKQKAIQKAKGSTDYKVTQNIIEKYNKYGYYNETYDANNPNYIFK
jgi:hypothetical protein